MTPPLLGLCMIVKNEAAGIAATLRSVLPFIDRYTVLDTGSTDGTQDLIRAELAAIPGSLHQEPFVDFATTRNRVLELHGEATTFALMLSGDDLVVNGALLPQPDSPAVVRIEALLTFLRQTTEDALNLVRITGTVHYTQAMIVRTTAGWRYQGKTHEVLVKEGQVATVTIPNVLVTRVRDGSAEQKIARWQLDAQLLETELAEDPSNARAAFYLAQSYECLGRLPEALDLYERRIRMPGWHDETYEATYRRARVMRAKGDSWDRVQQAYLDAHAVDPSRAEPLFEIAKHWYDSGRNYALCYLFASRAAALPYPPSRLFIEAEIYRWRAADLVAISAFHLARGGRFEVAAAGRAAADRALAARPDDERLAKNRAFYDQLAGDIVGTAWKAAW